MEILKIKCAKCNRDYITVKKPVVTEQDMLEYLTTFQPHEPCEGGCALIGMVSPHMEANFLTDIGMESHIVEEEKAKWYQWAFWKGKI